MLFHLVFLQHYLVALVGLLLEDVAGFSAVLMQQSVLLNQVLQISQMLLVLFIETVLELLLLCSHLTELLLDVPLDLHIILFDHFQISHLGVSKNFDFLFV